MTSQFTTQPDQHRFKTRDAESYDSVVAYFDRFTERFSAHMPAPLLAMANVPADGVVLDVGTGTGIVALGVAAGLGPAGKVVGIDLSDGMLATAEQKAKRTGLGDRTEFIRMDAEDLSFADNSFDACHMERLLQVIPSSTSPKSVMVEAIRVLKPGGRLVAADTDWATASVNYHDVQLERKLMSFFAQKMRPNGFAGRQLFPIMHDLKLENIEIEVFPLIQTNFSETPFGAWLQGEAVKNGIARHKQMDQWVNTLQQQSNNGSFFGIVNMVVISAAKPG